MNNQTKAPKSSSHKWHFYRLGGFDQVRLQSGADIVALDQLDQKLWAALSCPTHGLEFDSKTLESLDADNDGRIRVPDVIAAAKWAGSLLKDTNDLLKGSAELPLSAIDDSTPEGKELLSSARRILSNLGKAHTEVITAEDTADLKAIFANTRFNGDGIIPVESADDDSVKAVIREIIECSGSETDRTGAPGVSQEKVDAFFEAAQTYSDWWSKAENATAAIFVSDDKTTDAAIAFDAVKAKVDDYFTRCRLAAFDARATEPLNVSEEQLMAVAQQELSTETEALAAFPLAKIEAGKALPLEHDLNPAWAEPIARFCSAVVAPICGDKVSLTAEEWAAITARFAAYEAWLAAKTGAAVEKLGLKRVREILSGNSKAVLSDLIARDKALEPEANAIVSVDKLVRLHRDLYTLLNNFVSLRDFYSTEISAIFQIGTLYLDGRSCELCVRVEDVEKHSAFAIRSGTCLAYCNCTRRGREQKMIIAAAFTNGDADNLMVGRNGVFYDRQGQDWDATIVKLVENPISVRQAFWSPYKRIARMVRDQVEKMAGARDQAIEQKAAAGIGETAKAVETGKTPAAQTFDIAKFAGIFAAIGLALGAIGTAIASVVTGFLTLRWWQIPLAVVGLLLVISGPSMVMAWFKLRERNLAPILDANGWAVNTRAKINIPFGTALTGVAKLPPGARRSFRDPFAEKKRPWKSYLFLLVLSAAAAFLWHKGYLQQWYAEFLPKFTGAQTEEPMAAQTEQPEGGDTVPADITAAPTKTEPAAPSPGEQAPAKPQ